MVDDQCLPGRVGVQSLEHGSATFGKAQQGKNGYQEQHRQHQAANTAPHGFEHQPGVQAERSVNPDNHHHEQLLERITRRKTPVHRQHLPIDELEVLAELGSNVRRHHVRDQHGRCQQTQHQLHLVGACHGQRASCRNGMEPERRMHHGSRHERRSTRRTAPGVEQHRAPVAHGGQRVQAERQVQQMHDDKGHQYQAGDQPQVANQGLARHAGIVTGFSPAPGLGRLPGPGFSWFWPHSCSRRRRHRQNAHAGFATEKLQRRS